MESTARFDISAYASAVDQHANARYWAAQLRAFQETAEALGFTIVHRLRRAGRARISVDDLPKMERVTLSLAVCVARQAYLTPALTHEGHCSQAETDVHDGFAESLLREIMEGLAAQGLVLVHADRPLEIDRYMSATQQAQQLNLNQRRWSEALT